jgi:peptidoglycan hydrolase-like protein with peptidoglycan-binding domain
VIPAWWYRDIDDGDQGEDVLIVQRKVDAPMTGTFDAETKARVRGVQRRRKRKETGVVDAGTAEVLGEKPGHGQKPSWFDEDCKAGCSCPAVAQLRILLRQPNLPTYFDKDLEDAVRRYQSAEGLEVTGVVDLATATALANRSSTH